MLDENKSLVGNKKITLPKKLSVVIVFVVMVGSFLLALYFFIQYTRAKLLLQNPQQLTNEQTKNLVDKLGQLIELPNEQPTVATVTDKNKLKGQIFFTKAQNGDKVLIFTQAKKAILYRPSINKIIEVSPISIGPSQASSASASISPSQTNQVKIAIYNGTKIASLAGKTGDLIKQKIPNAKVTTTDANISDYKKSLVVDLRGSQKDFVNEIATIVKGSVGNLPEGEKKPDADVLIIVGQ